MLQYKRGYGLVLSGEPANTGNSKPVLLQKWRSLVFLRINHLTTVRKFILTLEPSSGTLLVHFNWTETCLCWTLPLSAGKLQFPKQLQFRSWMSPGCFRNHPKRLSVNHRPLEVPAPCWAGLGLPQSHSIPIAARSRRKVLAALGRSRCSYGCKGLSAIPSSSRVPSPSTFKVTQLAAFALRAFCSCAIAGRSETHRTTENCKTQLQKKVVKATARLNSYFFSSNVYKLKQWHSCRNWLCPHELDVVVRKAASPSVQLHTHIAFPCLE